MALKGRTLIELKNTQTGEVNRYADTNMLTNALDYILNDNLCGYHNFPTDYPSLCFPVVTQLLGGIMLFPDTIKEDAESIYMPTMPTGYGGDSTDAGDDTRMGTYNVTESGKTTDGYRHVWDFSTSQANGDISCVCLTHRLAGDGLFNNLANLYYCEGWVTTSYTASTEERTDDNDVATRLFGASQVVDYDGYRPITIGYDGSEIRVVEWDLVSTGTGVNSEQHSVPPLTRWEDLATFSTDDVGFSDNFIFAKMTDGKYHGYSHASNTSSDAVIYTVTIDPTDWSMEAGSITLSGRQIYQFSTLNLSPTTASSNGAYYRKFFCAIRGNNLYALSNALTKVYKINLSNTAKVTEISVPFTLTSGYFHMRYNPASQFIDLYCSREQSDGMYRYGCILADDTMAVGERSSSYGYDTSRNFTCGYGNPQFGENLVGIASYKKWYNGAQDVSEKYAFLGYIASINNITTFTKTAAQTMKITYTISETEEVTLASIVLAAEPDKTSYVAGEELDLTGMQVIAVYSDGVRKDVTASCLSDPEEGTELTDISLDEISIYYEEDGVTRYTTVSVTVYELESIAVLRAPTKVSYYSGDALDLTGLKVMGYFSDGTEADITDGCVYTPAEGAALTAGQSLVSVQYTLGLVTKIATFTISVTQVTLESISITAMPKTVYEPGDAFDLTGMEVMAIYNSGNAVDVSGNVTSSLASGTTLGTEGSQSVTITYSENSVTKTATFTIYVTEEVVPASLAVTALPDKTGYAQDDALDLTGAEVTVTYTDGTTQGVTNSCAYEPMDGDILAAAGTQVVKVSYTEDGVTVEAAFSVSVEAKPDVEIVAFADGTDAQIAAMVDALDAGIITIDDTGWQVGDERTVTLSAMDGGGCVGESQAEQTATLVIMDTDHYELTEATSGGDTKSHFVVGLKNALTTTGYLNPTSTNAGSWKDTGRRAWCNQIFRYALPEELQGCFKQFKVISATEYNGSTVTETDDYFALFAVKEIFGAQGISNAAEAEALTQIEYYQTSANRIKKQGDSGSSCYWWERSPYSGSSTYFCCVTANGGSSNSNATNTYGSAPFGCL